MEAASQPVRFSALSPPTRILLYLVASCSCGAAQQTASNPQRWQAQYTQIYFDGVEAVGPSVGAAFSLGPAGSLTSNPSEVISGTESIKGSYSGSGTYTPYLQTNPSVVPLTPNHSYKVTFQYKILTAPSSNFQVLFYSPTAGAQGNFLPQVTITGAAGTVGTATLTNTLGPYTDYEALWTIQGTGSISIDNIQVFDSATGKVIASENAEGTGPVLGSGLSLSGGLMVTDPSLVLSGSASVRLRNGGALQTNPAILPLAGNTTYIVQTQYRILNPGSGQQTLHLYFQPAGTVWTPQIQVDVPPLLQNATATGTFSAGALTASASSWFLHIAASSDSDVIVDNISIFRQDPTPANTLPLSWSKLRYLPYPRLGHDMQGTTLQQAYAGGLAEGPPQRVSVDEIENALAFADVIEGLDLRSQTQSPDSIRRLRQLNPNAVILPIRAAAEQADPMSAPNGSDTDIEYQFLGSMSSKWFLKTTEGMDVPDPGYPDLRKMNISAYSPVVSGDTYYSALLKWLNSVIFASGIWDGVRFDNLFGRINPHILNATNPSLLDVDYEGTGIRSETPAWVTGMTRTATTGMLQQLQSMTGGAQIVLGNAGDLPELALAPYVNGYLFECMDAGWDPAVEGGQGALSPAGWRREFDAYRLIQSIVRQPQINIISGCGREIQLPGSGYSTPTPSDLQRHRLTMGTSMLGDGFYGFNLHGNLSAAVWMDEYSVDSSGTAVRDLSKKGYLGQPLGDATELTDPGTQVFQETFESGVVPSSFVASPGVLSIIQSPDQVISGTGSLVISNLDFADTANVTASIKPGAVPFVAGSTYLLVFDWRILKTLDHQLAMTVGGNGQTLDYSYLPGVVAGDSGTQRFPFTIPATGNWQIFFALQDGGGQIAIDNFTVYQGGVGPWRRDFENGFVLVNPLAQPHTFSAADLAGTLHRTAVHRINGTQAPDINNGQPVTDSLTLGPFDAIILLADPIPVGVPVVTGVSNAAGGQPGVASGSFVSIYGWNFTPLAYDDWSKSITNGRLPTQLDA